MPRPPKERAQTTCTDAARYRLIQKKYTQQYSDMYFLRLTELKPVVEKLAYESWEGFEVCFPE